MGPTYPNDAMSGYLDIWILQGNYNSYQYLVKGMAFRFSFGIVHMIGYNEYQRINYVLVFSKVYKIT